MKILNHIARWSLSAMLPLAAFGALAASHVSDKTAVVAVTSDPGHFNPAITTGYNVHVVADSLFNGLVALDKSLSPIPDLAQSWSVDKDSKVYTFNLAKNVRWHDGKPFTSADVKFTFENILLKYHSRTKAGLGSVIDTIETPDANTVVFRLKKSYGPLLQRLDVTEAPILPMHIYQSGGDANKHPGNLKPVGTGPFKLVSYKPGEAVNYERNSDYFKEGLPKLDKLVFRIIPDGATQLLAMEQGEVDYLNRIPNGDVKRLQTSGKFKLTQSSTGPGGGNCIVTLTYNLDRKLLQSLDVRKAIALAIDRQRIVDQVLFGWGKPTKAPISSAISWAHASGSLSQYSYDPAKAEALLEGAGYKKDGDGTRLTIDVVHFPSFGKYAEVLKQDLAKVGIKLKSRPLDRAAAIDAIFKKRDFDTNVISYCNGLDPDIGVKRMYVSNNIGPIPFSNGAAYRNDTIDKLFNEAGQTSDQTIRSKKYGEIQTILGQELPYWWLVERTFISGHSKSLSGFRPWTGQFAEHAGYN